MDNNKGSAGFKNQFGHTRVVGSDPLAKMTVKQRSKVQPKAKAPEPDTLRPSGWRGLGKRGHG